MLRDVPGNYAHELRPTRDGRGVDITWYNIEDGGTHTVLASRQRMEREESRVLALADLQAKFREPGHPWSAATALMDDDEVDNFAANLIIKAMAAFDKLRDSGMLRASD